NHGIWWQVAKPSPEWLSQEKHSQKFNRAAAIPSVDWESVKLSVAQIRQWYTRRGLQPPELDENNYRDFARLMSAQVYRPHNPYGALNFGHDVDWNKGAQQLFTASPAKHLGALLRSM